MTQKMRPPRGKKDDKAFLEHILIAIEEIEDIAADGITEDTKTAWSIERELEIIGEASRNLSKEFIAAHAHIPWRKIIGMRHKISHDYFGIDFGAVKDVLKYDIPELKMHLTSLLQQLKTDGTS